MSKKKKTLLIVGGLLGVLVLGFGSWFGAIYFSAGSVYEGELESLLPEDAVMVIRVDDLASNYTLMLSNVDDLFVRRNAFAAFEATPLWQGLFLEDGEAGQAPTVRSLVYEQIKPAIDEAQAQMTAMPIEIDLFGDVIGDEIAVGLYPEGEELKPILLTRVSETVDFGWSFRGWGEGSRGDVTIEKDGDLLRITDPEGDTYIGLFDDVLAISPSKSRLESVAALHEAEGSGENFSGLPAYKKTLSKVTTAQQGYNGYIRAFANLDAVRSYQGPDPEDDQSRAPIDQYFAVSREVMQLSPEIMPTLAAALEHAIDTRVFSLAGWALDLSGSARVEVNQFLTAEEERLDKHPKLKPAWSLDASEMKIREYLPEGTWLMMSNRMPVSIVREQLQPKKNTLGDVEPSVVYSFLKSLGDDPSIDEIGVALFDTPYGFHPENDRDYLPPKIVTGVPFPPFALYIHVPGVDQQRALNLMQLVLNDLEATKLFPKVAGEGFVYFDNPQDESALRWMTQFSCAAVGEYLVFSYTKQHKGIMTMLELAGSSDGTSFKTQPGSPFGLLDATSQSALVYIDPRGFRQFSQFVGLSKQIGESYYDPQYPFGESWRDIHNRLSAQFPNDPDRVQREKDIIKGKWDTKRMEFIQEYNSTLGGLDVFSGFTAQTLTTFEAMQTNFLIQLR